MVIYEQRLDADLRLALEEGGRHFEGRSAVQLALRKITSRLGELNIPYVVAGGMALFSHGLRRFTEGVDILVTKEDLKTIHRNLAGLGYRPPFEGSKNLRDVESGVRIEFLVTGDYPGDGRPKPVAFPQPSSVAEERDGIQYLNLATLVELKLASGMTNPQRVQDLADVQELIKLLNLPQSFGESLNPYARPKYDELWAATRVRAKRFLKVWHPQSRGTEELEAMLADGVVLENDHLVTTDPEVARKYDMHDESEFWSPDEA